MLEQKEDNLTFAFQAILDNLKIEEGINVLSLFASKSPRHEKLTSELLRSLESWQTMDPGQIPQRAKALLNSKKIKEFISTVPKIYLSANELDEFLQNIECLPIIYAIIRTSSTSIICIILNKD